MSIRYKDSILNLPLSNGDQIEMNQHRRELVFKISTSVLDVMDSHLREPFIAAELAKQRGESHSEFIRSALFDCDEASLELLGKLVLDELERRD